VRHAAAPAVLAAAVAMPATAVASTSEFRVTAATHSSSSAKVDGTYAGRSTATWSLTRATRAAPNRVTVQRTGRVVSGGGMINVRGTFTATATDGTEARCALTAHTGDRRHPLVAPKRFMLAIGPHPDDARRLVATFGAVHATLANPYFGSDCSTSVVGEPRGDETSLVAVSAAQLRRRRLTLRFAGTTNRDAIAYRWSTTIRLKRTR
jgi:hypothetical protein